MKELIRSFLWNLLMRIGKKYMQYVIDSVYLKEDSYAIRGYAGCATKIRQGCIEIINTQKGWGKLIEL